MKNKYLSISFIAGLFLTFGFVSCDDKIDPPIEEVQYSRVLTPTGLTGIVVNLTTIELNWSVREDADYYVVEFSEDNLEFNSIMRTVTVEPGELPVRETFFGDTQYSARVKGVSNDGVPDSKWSALTLKTSPEQILLPINLSQDIGITQATLKWPAGQTATRFVINPGNITRDITADEVAAGQAILDNLNSYTEYSVLMYAGNSQRGSTAFKTLFDKNCATCVNLTPGQDISDAITAAAPGSTIVLAPGTYPDEGAIVINKAITVQGALYYNLPVVYAGFSCNVAVTSFAVKDAVFRGDSAVPLNNFFTATSGINLTALSIEGCEIRNYVNSFLSSTATSGVTFGSMNVKNCYVHTIAGGGGDGIDFRGGTVGSLTVENSTFANGFRAFLRMQTASNTLFKNCTFYKICALDNSNNTGIFRAGGTAGTNNLLEVRNCLFSETGVAAPVNTGSGNFCRNASNMVAAPTYANNNISGCLNLLVGLYTTAAAISASELNPGFVNAPAGNFKVTNQTIITNNIGDPRWLK
ncbi:MAG TPA: DUF4957 domain-containing protein [Cyclobacteriaceae bacterium]|nr:DUF4957 domain-containing protein [Cyclobacteriaceae bacterium]